MKGSMLVPVQELQVSNSSEGQRRALCRHERPRTLLRKLAKASIIHRGKFRHFVKTVKEGRLINHIVNISPKA